jgi:hypothetical protein
MKNTAVWKMIALALIGTIACVILVYGHNGIIIGLVMVVLFFLGLDGGYRWRSNNLARSMKKGETLVASGLVSDSMFDETPAILVRIDENRYRIYVADTRGRQMVLSVSSELSRHNNIFDMKRYIEMFTDRGKVHFAPRKGISVAKQPGYANEVMANMLAHGVPLKVNPNSA